MYRCWKSTCLCASFGRTRSSVWWGQIITTNKSIRDWTELLAGDEVLATAILDRLLHRAHVLNIRGRSYRLRDLEDTLKG
jgi:DNA replication protein DnaC